MTITYWRILGRIPLQAHPDNERLNDGIIFCITHYGWILTIKA